MEPMVSAGFLVLFAFGIALLALMKWAQPQRGFPYCRRPRCGKTCIRKSAEGRTLPFEIQMYLACYKLPEHVVSRYVCPKGHTEVWYVSRLGDVERGILISRDL